VKKAPPLGRREDLHLEFKSRDVLESPEKVAREVVAMLNADGGEIWIGLAEDHGRAVKVEPIADPEERRRQLLDFLIDKIEPSLRHDEIQLEACEVEDPAGDLLVVSVRPESRRRPYAYLQKGGRFFSIRVDDRIRPMEREELLGPRPGPDDEARLDQALAKALERRKRWTERGDERLWLSILPLHPLEIDLQDPHLSELLTDPTLTGNRPEGWTFVASLHRPRLAPGRLETPAEESRQVTIESSGALTFSVPLEFLHWKGDEREIWPPILVEYPVSAFRLAQHIYRQKIAPTGQAVADLALVGAQGWALRPGAPDPWFTRSANRPRVFDAARDLVLDRPLVFTDAEIESEPDRCGARLVERVYEAFGLGREAMPQLDAKTGRLVFPSR
jgi:hypothetical protein